MPCLLYKAVFGNSSLISTLAFKSVGATHTHSLLPLEILPLIKPKLTPPSSLLALDQEH